ncbi:MAG: hypothetical protein V4530_13500 [Pseudomonadota bacterium]
MISLLKKGVLGVALGASALTMAAPAQAQRYDNRYYHRDRGNNDAAVAIGAGVLGLAVGAAIASNNNDRYYDGGYYNRRYYAGPRYYGYNSGYYYGPRYRSYPRYNGYDRGYRGYDRGYYGGYRGPRYRNW